MGIIIGLLGLIAIAFGGVLLLGSFMPTFGGSRNDGSTTSIVGIGLIVTGCGLIFYGGSWL